MTHTHHQSVSLILAHINDTHSYFEPSSLQLTLNIEQKTLQPYVSVGGFARISTRVNQLREQAKQNDQGFLFLHAGDCFQGTLYFSLFKGQANAELLNALNIDAMALGNHELDMGNEPVARFLQQIDFPLLAGNWDVSNELTNKSVRVSDSDKLHSYNTNQQCANWITKTVQGVEVAIFSLALDKMSDISNPDQETPFLNSVKVAHATVQAIHQCGIKNIILLSHLGYEVDLDLAKKIDGIGVIVGGHSHRLQGDFSSIGLEKDDDYGQRIKDTFVVQAGYHALSIGHCEITFDTTGKVSHFNGKNELLLGRRLCLDASLSEAYVDNAHQKASEKLKQNPNIVICKKDPQVHDILLNKYIPRVRKLQETVISNSDRFLRHVRIPDQHGASELAPLVAESFHYMMNKQGYQVDFAIHNAGGVRDSLYPGDITIADISGKLLPFVLPVGVYQIEGRYIAQILEGALNNAFNNGVEGTGSGSFPYTHNLRFEYVAGNQMGMRIESLQLKGKNGNWQPIDEGKVYSGTSSAYTMKGKEGYGAITKMQLPCIISCSSMADCFIEFLEDNQHALQQGSAWLYTQNH